MNNTRIIETATLADILSKTEQNNDQRLTTTEKEIIPAYLTAFRIETSELTGPATATLFEIRTSGTYQGFIAGAKGPIDTRRSNRLDFTVGYKAGIEYRNNKQT